MLDCRRPIHWPEMKYVAVNSRLYDAETPSSNDPAELLQPYFVHAGHISISTNS